MQDTSDPRLKDVVITDVRLTGDLKQADVYYSTPLELDPKQEKLLLTGFRHASPFLRRRMGESLELRYVPELHFRKDTHGSDVGRLMKLMENIQKVEN